MEKYKDLVIIITDDDDGHAELILDGLRNSGVANKIIRFCDGEYLWDFLTGSTVSGNAFDSSKAYLLLLDINMPRLNGVEVLARMKGDARLKDIPIMMLTTTEDPREVERCYRLGCNVYITKPVDFAQFAETLHRLGLFLQVVRT